MIKDANAASAGRPFKKIPAPPPVVAKEEPRPQLPTGYDKWEDAVAAFVRQGAINTAAMVEARTRHPELYEAMQKRALPTKKTRPFDQAVSAFSELVNQISREDRIGKAAAMTAARKRFPTEFEAAYPR